MGTTSRSSHTRLCVSVRSVKTCSHLTTHSQRHFRTEQRFMRCTTTVCGTRLTTRGASVILVGQATTAHFASAHAVTIRLALLPRTTRVRASTTASPVPLQRLHPRTIASDSQIPIGHFSLTFTDYYGDTFTTKPIPTEVQLSCTARTYLGAATQTPTTTVTFDCADGLPAHELSEYDYVRIGADYLKVEAAAHATATDAAGWATRAITWADQFTINSANTKSIISEFRSARTHIRSFETPTPASTGRDGTSNQLPHLEGTRIYRQDVSPEIRRALEAIPNNRIEGCSVEAIERTGIQPWPVVIMKALAGLSSVSGLQVDPVRVDGSDPVMKNSNVFTYASANRGHVKPTAAN